MIRPVTLAKLLVCIALIHPPDLRAQAPEFMSLESAKPVLSRAWGDGSHPGSTVSAKDWLAWLQKSDAEVRQRLDAGEEDSLTKILRFGTTFTKEYRIDDEYLLKYGHSSLVNAFAENRANDLIKALGTNRDNQGFVEMRAYVEKKGFSVASAVGRKKLKAYLLVNLARMQKEFLQAREQNLNRDQKFAQRGISLDSNLWPDYDLDQQLKEMLDKRMLKASSVRRVAIVGPGLDFVNKQEGVDFYPPQTVQPFAVVDSLLRLGLAKAEDIQVATMDISSRVNLHIEAARKGASSGKPYTVQLPWYAGGRWTPEFNASFRKYWQRLGAEIGEPVRPIPVPAAISGFETRAVKVRPGIVARVTPLDLNVVYQRLQSRPQDLFDLVVGTNIFIYYGGFEQSLARVNVAAMLKPGGYLLTNDKLEEAVKGGLEQVLITSIPMTTEPVITDHIYCYRKAE